MLMTDEVLKQILGNLPACAAWKDVSEQGRLPCATYVLASLIILDELGPEWTQRHVGRSDKACDYFRAGKLDEEMLRYLARATEFGELVYNLREVAPSFSRVRFCGC
jgi:hypothetical protein